MLSFLHFRSRPLVCLDICSDEIRLLHLKYPMSSSPRENFAVASLPPGVIIDGKVVGLDAVVSTIYSLVQQTGTQRFPAAIALPASSVIIKRIQLPYGLTDVECRAEICTQLPSFFPGVAEEIYFDFVIQESKESDFQNILFIAAKNEMIELYRKIVHQARLNLKIIDVNIYALARYVFADELLFNKTIVLIDVNVDTVHLILIQSRDVIFHQLFSVDLSSPLAMNELCQQILNSIQMCSSMHHLLRIERLVLSGKTIYFPPISNFLSEYLKIPIIYKDQWALCKGLSLRSSSQW